MLSKILLASALVVVIGALPWEPVPKDDANWLVQHERFVNNTNAQRESINVLFYGDSITAGWNGAGKPIYDKEYAPLGTANYGIGGDKIEHVFWRVINGEVEGLHPKVIVLKIGTNNGGDTGDNIVIGIASLVLELSNRMPNAQILLLGILPRTDTDAMYVRLSDINIKIAHIVNSIPNVHFLDMWNQFSIGWPTIDPVLFNPDKVHLLEPGYQKWADTMRKSFDKLLNA